MRCITAVLVVGILVLLIGSASAEPRVWTGLEKSFTKPADSDWTSPTYQDKITDKVIITRGDKKGIFNIAQEPGYKPSPPKGTEWAYGKASDWEDLRFHSFETWNSRIPPNMVDQDAVLHLIEEDVYLDIKFTSWTEGDGSGDGGGGGFSYVRATEGVAGEKVWTGSTITFTKADYADWTLAANQDRITDDVWITRRDKQGIFNIAQEREYRLNPPSGTLWAFGDAADWATLTFQPLAKLNKNDPASMVDKAAVMYLIDEDAYVNVKFLTWRSYAVGGGFSYSRATEGTPGEKVWSGANMTYVRDDWAGWTTEDSQDRITDDVWIARGRWDGIYNAASETAYQPYPPAGTEWAFGSAADWESLIFVSWEALHQKNPPSLVGKDLVMHLMEEDIYLDVRFDSWAADDTGGGFSWTRAENDKVTILGGPLALPSTVSVDNGYVSFRVVVDDPDNEPILCTWDFGDGATGTGETTSHTYTTAGLYEVKLSVTDGTDVLERSVYVRVNTPPRIDTGPTASLRHCLPGEFVDFSVTATDDDGDPITYTWRFGDGTTSNDADASHAWTTSGDYIVEVEVTDNMHSTKATLEVTVAKVLTVTKLSGGVNFKKPLKDKIKLKGAVDLPADFDPEGVTVDVFLGGIETSFTLDAKGKAKGLLGAAKMKYSKKTGKWAVLISLKKGDFAETWAALGMVNETVKDMPVTIPARVKVGETTFTASADVLYKAKELKSGKFKSPKPPK